MFTLYYLILHYIILYGWYSIASWRSADGSARTASRALTIVIITIIIIIITTTTTVIMTIPIAIITIFYYFYYYYYNSALRPFLPSPPALPRGSRLSRANCLTQVLFFKSGEWMQQIELAILVK